MRMLLGALFVVCSFGVVQGAETESAKSEYEGKTVTYSGYLHQEEGEYRLNSFDTKDKSYYRLHLTSDNQRAWAPPMLKRAIKVTGTYRDGGNIQVEMLEDYYYDEVARQMVEEANRYRALHKLAPLIPITNLLYTAHRHSTVMAAKGMHHGNSTGWHAENVAKSQRTAADATRTWYYSSDHRANLLGNFRYIGVGHFNHCWTQQFMR